MSTDTTPKNKELSTTELLSRYECAQEMLSGMIASLAAKIGLERGSAQPDAQAIHAWEKEQGEFTSMRRTFGLHDTKKIEHIISTYGPILMAEFRASQ